MFKRLFSWAGLVVAVVLFLAVNAVSSTALRGARVDLTENSLYTLSQGTRNILASLDEPVTLRLYYSKSIALKELGGTPIPSYAQRVTELLEEYEAAAGTNLALEIIEPEPFSEEEDQAVGYQLRGVPVGPTQDQLFFGVVGTNSVDEVEAIPFFDPSREASLEYDLTQMIYRLAVSDRPVVGLLSNLPLEAGPAADPRNPQPPQNWAILDWIRQSLEVQTIEAGAESIPDEIDVLMLVHPKDLSPATEYAIDQFALRGGRVLAFVDPFSLFDPAQGDPQMGGMGADKSSKLDNLLAAWGVQIESGKVVGDDETAQPVPGPGGQRVRLPLFMNLTPDLMGEDDFVTAELGSLSMLAPGHLSAVEDAKTTLEVMAHTSTDGAGTLDAMMMQFGQDFGRLAEMFTPDRQQRNLIVRVTGPITTAFPDGKPAGAALDTEESSEEEGEDGEEAVHLESSDSFEAIIVADADLLSDNLWVTRQNFLGQVILQAMSGNGSFVVNALENLSGSTDLISLRSREGFQRPFTRKDELRLAAEAAYQQKNEELEKRLQDTQAEINRLRSPEENSGLLVNDEQEAALEKFQDEYVEIRKELRDVKRQLNSDIETLGSRLKWLNIAAVPLGLILIGLLTFCMKAMGGNKS